MTPAGKPARAVARLFDTPVGQARALVTRPADAAHTLILGHGAGGGFGALDLQLALAVFTAHGFAVALVEQPWLVAGRKVATPPPTLDAAWVPVVEGLRSGPARLPGRLVVGGRSAGARVACRTGRHVGADGTLLLSFPLHLPGKPEKSRADELAQVVLPAHLVHGQSDPFGTPEDIRPVMPAGLVLHEVPGAHSFGASSRDALEAALTVAAEGLSGIGRGIGRGIGH